MRPDDNEATQAKIRQQLAIHSLIRQANFDDDDGDDGVTISSIPRSNVELQLGAMPPTQSNFGTPLVLDRATLSGPPVVEGLQILREGTPIQTHTVTDEPVWRDSHGSGEWPNSMQLVLDPWMGFSESLESYGLKIPLNEDYF